MQPANGSLGAQAVLLSVEGRTAFQREDAAPLSRRMQSVTLHAGDVRDFDVPGWATSGFVMHAATEASAKQLEEEPAEMLSTILAGTERSTPLKIAAEAWNEARSC